MATISKRKTAAGIVRWTVQIRRKNLARPLVKTFATKDQAKRWAQVTEVKVENNLADIDVEAEKHSLREAIARYKREILIDRKDSAAVTGQLDWWAERLGDCSLAHITTAQLAEAKGYLRSTTYTRSEAPDAKEYERTPATVNRYMAAISHVLSVCVEEWYWLSKSRLPSVPKFRESRGRVRMLSTEELKALRTALGKSESPYLKTIVEIALVTGARRSEVAGLTWPRVDLKRKMAIVEDTKNDDRRALHLHGPALAALTEMSKVRRIDSALVFPAPNDSSRPYDFESAWQTTLTRAKIQNFRFHDLRHSCASYLAMNGATTGEIAEVLGHKTLAMVKRYSHLTESHAGSVVERMAEKMLSEETAPTETDISASA